MDRKWWTLIAVCLATFMLLLDITIVNVALPSIQRDLGSSFSDLQWVIDAYSLTLAALLLTAGSLADLFGRRRLFAIGLTLFTLASLLCGLSTTPVFLNLARAAQGIGGSIMFATSLALLASAFHGRERGTAFGIWGATIAAAAAVGPLVGGALTEGLGWQWIFFLNIPIGIATLTVALTQIPESRDPDARGVDWGGVVTFSAALFLLVYALIRANAEGWGSTGIVARLVAAAVLLVAFVEIERRQERPMLDLSLFRKGAFAGASIAAFALSAGMFAMFLYLVLYLQNVLDFSPLATGVRFLPFTVVSFVAAPIAGRLAARYPARIFLGAGLIATGVGLVLMSGIDSGSSWTHLLPGFIIAGAGVGTANPTLASIAVGVVEPARAGMASGINNTFRQVGIATGIAGLGAVFQGRVEHKLSTALAGTPATAHVKQLAEAVAGGGGNEAVRAVPVQARAAVSHAANLAFISALNEILVIGGIIAIAGGIVAAILVRSRDFVSQGAAPEQAPAPA